MKKHTMKLAAFALSAVMAVSPMMMAMPAFAEESELEVTEEAVLVTEDVEVLEDMVEIPEDTEEASEVMETETEEIAVMEEEAADVIELTPSTTTGMFKPVSAKIVTVDGQKTLDMVLSSSGYKELFLGTYEDAVVHGDGSIATGDGSWIHGVLNGNKQCEFQIPLTDTMLDGSIIPLVSVSNSYYEKYVKGENAIERSFFPRQIQIDLANAQLIAGDLNWTSPLSITQDAGLALKSADLQTIGGPNSNGYKENLVMVVADGAIDQVKFGENIYAPVAENTFVLTFRSNEKGGSIDMDLLDQEVALEVHNSTTDRWTEYTAVVSKSEKNMTLTKVIKPISNGVYKVNMTSSLGMFKFDAPVEVMVKNDTATVKMHSVTSGGRYDQMFIGSFADLDSSNAIIGEADPGHASDGSMAYYFTFQVPVASLTEGQTIPYVLRYSESYEKNPGVWYQGKSGDYYLTIGEGEKVSELPIDNVTNLKAVSAGKNKVTLTWDPVEDAEGYLIYARKAGKYAYVNMTTQGTTYTDKTALDSDYNYYFVYAYYKNAEGKMITGGCEKYAFAKGVTLAVTNLKAASKKGSVLLTWSASQDAEGYLVYGFHGNPKNVKYGFIGMTTKGTSYNDNAALKGEFNYYYVFPYHKDASGKMIVGGTAKYTYGRAN